MTFIMIGRPFLFNAVIDSLNLREIEMSGENSRGLIIYRIKLLKN